MSGPRVFTVPAEMPFVDALVAGIEHDPPFARDPADPLALGRLTILLPTRRACRALGEAFLRRAGRPAMLLPRIRPIGDLDDDEAGLEEDALSDGGGQPPAIEPLHRQMLLARLIRKLGDAHTGIAAQRADQAMHLAIELARFLDQVQTERLDLGNLENLAPERFSEHWQSVLTFLSIVTEHWPKILSELGLVDPVARRNSVLETLARQWQSAPPAHPIIAAGSTGSQPATADLLSVVASLPQGCLVLPALDQALDAESWEALEATHPQVGLKQLLARIGIERGDVKTWSAPGIAQAKAARVRLLGEALRPAATTDTWQDLKPPRTALEGLRRVDCKDAQEEAGVIALLLREALETPARSAALVTAERGLARRVAAELRRWNITIDDSAGLPLAETPPATFLRLTARVAAGGAMPIDLLAALKHPLAAGGVEPAAFRRQVRALELAVLRGPRPAPGLNGIAEALEGTDAPKALRAWFAGVAKLFADFETAMTAPARQLSALVTAHSGLAETLAASAGETGQARLWAGDAGERTSRLMASLIERGAALGEIAPADYPALLDVFMAGQVVRPRFGQHPKLAIWGPLEARLQHADRMILGGLNEGSWPPEPPPDPWMSRPMRDAFGLTPPERRIGLSAHDFVMCAAAPDVVLTRARRIEGTPTIPSRWLSRLDAVLEHLEETDNLRRDEQRLLNWRSALDVTAGGPASAPQPRPPVAARPRRLSVTQVETWITDPYAIYARHILRLRALDDIDADPGAADRGTIIHDVLDDFIRRYPDDLPADATEKLVALGHARFADHGVPPGVMAFWWPRFRRIAAWLVALERTGRADWHTVATEVNGRIEFEAPGGAFTLTAKADRIDRTNDGALTIIDYKTGNVPTGPQVESGMRPQLSLEALIAEQGGFRGVDPAPVAALAYWHLSGGDPAGAVRDIKSSPHDLAAAARDGLSAMIALFDRVETPYLVTPRGGAAPRYNDYAHLERAAEWSVPGEGDDGA